MKITLLSFEFPELCVRMAGGLAKLADVQLILANEQNSDFAGLLDPSIHYQSLPKARLRQPLQQLVMISRILRFINKFNPDVIHFQEGHLWFNLALPMLRNFPLVITIHDPIHHPGDTDSKLTPQAIMDYGFRQASQIIVHGNNLKKNVIERLHISPDRIHVVPLVGIGDNSGLDALPEEEHMILFFGRIWEYKGLEYLIRAEPLITEKVPDVKIVIAGKGEDFSHYRKLMVHPERFIVYNEFIPNSQIKKLFQQASVIALPYVEASQSGVIPLAFTYGKPVVVTNVGSLTDMVVDGVTGLVVPPRQIDALAEALICLLQNRGLRHKLGLNGKHKIDTDCSPSAVAHQTLIVYRRAINRMPANS